MAEVVGRDGVWAFDGETLRIVPGHDRGVHRLRKVRGEVAVPLQAVAGIAFEPGRKTGCLRLRLREGADPLLQVTGGRISDSADPYQLWAVKGRVGVAEYFADEVRHALLIEQVPAGACDRYLVPGPQVPVTATAGDGTATFDGEAISLEWNWTAVASKKSVGARRIPVDAVSAVEWVPLAGGEDGQLCFRTNDEALPELGCVRWSKWGVDREGGTTALVAAAVAERLPHPSDTAAALPSGESRRQGEDHDAILRRLRELGELHADGVLTDEEFTAAKQGLIRRLHD